MRPSRITRPAGRNAAASHATWSPPVESSRVRELRRSEARPVVQPRPTSLHRPPHEIDQSVSSSDFTLEDQFPFALVAPPELSVVRPECVFLVLLRRGQPLTFQVNREPNVVDGKLVAGASADKDPGRRESNNPTQGPVPWPCDRPAFSTLSVVFRGSMLVQRGTREPLLSSLHPL